MANIASVTGNQTHVNGVWVMTFADTGWATGALRAATVAERLNSIFSDSARDLDFITPSFQQSVNGGYCVVCPPVRYPGGTPTYFNVVSGCGPGLLPSGTSRNNQSPCAAGSTLCGGLHPVPAREDVPLGQHHRRSE